MNQESWAHILTIVGSVLLSVELFKSEREEKDEAIGWWGGNPFQTSTRKVIGFVGLLLIILGFAVELDHDMNPGVIEQTASLWFVAAITLAAAILVFTAYLVVGPWHARRRRRHFARLASDLVTQWRTHRVNPIQLYNGMLGYVPHLPERFHKILDQVYSEKVLFQDLAGPSGQMSETDRQRFIDAVVVQRKEAFDHDLAELEEYLRSLSGTQANRR